jgi:hypothetical protein
MAELLHVELPGGGVLLDGGTDPGVFRLVGRQECIRTVIRFGG